MTITEVSRLQAATLRAELSRRANAERLAGAGMHLHVNPPPDLEKLKTDDLIRELDLCLDDRKEIEDAAVPALARAQASAVAAIIPVNRLVQRPNQDSLLTAPAMGDFFNLDASERFRDQPVGAVGAASLITSQLVVTAAHVVPNPQILRRVRLVFGYRLTDGTPATVFPANHVYEATLFWIDVRRDIALLQLDRPVSDHHAPLIPRRAAGVSDGEALYVIGHPIGLPAKFTDNGRVLDNRGRRFFTTDLDVMNGSSGSPVFSAASGELVGVVSTAPVGFTTVNGRLVSDFCHDPNDVPIGVSRITNLPG
jgi:hypothetical protein